MTLEYLCKPLSWELKSGTVSAQFRADSGMLLEVCENVIANVVHYAKNMLEVTVCAQNDMLYIEFYDDGEGFSEKQEIVMKAYYYSNSSDDLNHFGMGLYISRLYCEKYGRM